MAELNTCKNITAAGLASRLLVGHLHSVDMTDNGFVVGMLLTFIDGRPIGRLQLFLPFCERKAWVIWGDVKAWNALIDQDDNAWIIDLGGSYTRGLASWEMPSSISVPQAALAGMVLVSTIGTYSAISPPNPNPNSASPVAGDSIARLKLTNKYAIRVAMVPIGLLALHTSSLACLYPNIPTSILRHGAENGLNTHLITWSSTTAVPLALILCAGIPLRRGPYAALGKNFTFALAEPDRLTTTGIYRYVQHPSYAGLMTLILCNASLLGRVDGVLSCWIPPRLYPYFQSMELVLAPVGVLALMFAVWTRVRQEERMLRAKFGIEWEQWHARTWRFIPLVF